MLTRRGFYVSATFVVLLCSALATWMVSGSGGQWLDNLALLAAPLFCAAVCALTARKHDGAVKRAWYLLGAAALSWGIGQTIWIYIEKVVGREVPFPSAADFGYLPVVPLAGAGLLAYAGGVRRISSTARNVLDALIVAVGLLFLSWALVLGSIFRAGEGSIFEQALALAYPVGDVAIITLVLLILPRCRGRASRPLLLVGFGLALLAVADTGFAYLTQAGTYKTGNVIDAAWFAGYLVIALGALYPGQAAPLKESRKPLGHLDLSLPYVPAVGAAAITAGSVLRNQPLDPFLLILGFSLIALVISRQFLTLMDNASLSRELEGKVVDRTAALQSITAELGIREEFFRSIVQNASDLILVCDASGQITFSSPSTHQILGFKPADIVGRRLMDLVHKDDSSLKQALSSAAAQSGSTVAAEVQMSRSNGGWRLMETMVTSMLENPTVEGFVLNARDISERHELEDQLQHQAFHDSLTGLANRALFQNRLEHALGSLARHWDSLTVLLIDVDDIKTINDTLSFAAGDLVLKELAKRISGCVRPADTAAHIGGDEFGVLIQHPNAANEHVILAERLLEAIHQPVMVSGRQIHPTASVGLSTTSDARMSADDLMRSADVALHVAKGAGKGVFRTFEPGMYQAIVERATLHRDLDQGLIRQEFFLHYQPLIEIATSQVVGVEALVRWHHPKHGVVPPAAFIPVAEQKGTIVALGEWVLETACRDLQEWEHRDKSQGQLALSVNLSARQLTDPHLVDTVHAVLGRTSFDPARLTLEITESALMEDIQENTSTIERLRDLGIRLAIDDFGTGYSSLAYLAQLPVKVLKIDRTFVAGLSDPTKSSLVRSILSMAHDLGLLSLAEGIEQQEWLDELHALGCEFGQGFYYSPPVALPDLQDAILRSISRRLSNARSATAS